MKVGPDKPENRLIWEARIKREFYVLDRKRKSSIEESMATNRRAVARNLLYCFTLLFWVSSPLLSPLPHFPHPQRACLLFFIVSTGVPRMGLARILVLGEYFWVGLVENFRKFSKDFLRKFLEVHYFSIFFKKHNKPCVNFSLVWTKNTSWEILRKFWNFLMKIQ